MRFVAPLLALTAACDSPAPITGKDAPSDDVFDRPAMLGHLATNLLVPMQHDVAVKTAALATALGAHCDALDLDVTASPVAARAAFADAIDAWQSADALVFGPAAMDGNVLRDRIYSWPLLAPCNVDKDTAASSFAIADKPINQRSLTAIEYLLYPPSTASLCPIEPANWPQLDKPRARCRHALAIAQDVAQNAAALETAWQAYATELPAMGHAGVNLVSDAMFYSDTMVKDMKLGEAAGIVVNACGTAGEICEREVELRFSDRGTFALRRNLATLRAAFTGTTTSADGPSFDDFLRAVDQGAMADRMVAHIDATIAKLAALPDSYLGALTTKYAEVAATHAALREFTTELKSQFSAVLVLEIPDDVATDND